MEFVSNAKENQCYVKDNTYYIVADKFQLEPQVPRLSRAFLKALDSKCPLILIDCTNLQKICVATSRVLLYFLNTLPEKKLTLALFNLQPELTASLEVTGLAQHLAICRSETEAKALLAG